MLHEIMDIERALPWLALAGAIGFLAGSIPSGVILARVFGLGDLRKIGSGNIGATNVLRTGSKKAAALTLLMDMLKGLIPTAGFIWAWGDLAGQAAGIGAVLGHCFSPWLGFRGGKGVATFLGVILGLYWLAGILVCATWLATAAVLRISSASALVAAASAPIWLWLLGRPEAVLTAAGLAVFIWLRHGANIARLVRGEEPKIGQSKRD